MDSLGQPRAVSFCADFKCGIKPVLSNRGKDCDGQSEIVSESSQGESKRGGK